MPTVELRNTGGCRMGALMVILCIFTTITAVWTVASFILHLFKDEPFSSLSAWLTAGGFVCVGLLFIWMLANDNF